MTQESSKYSRYFKYIKPAARSPIIKTYGSAIFTIISIIVFIFFAIKPTLETIVVLQKKIENAKQSLQAINKKSSDLTKAKENYEKIDQSIIAKIEASIPSNPLLDSMVTTLEQSANAHDATISAVQIEPITITRPDPKTVGTLAESSFTFNINGSYDNILQILDDLKKSSRIVSINKISITKAGTNPDLVMSINGKMYYIK